MRIWHRDRLFEQGKLQQELNQLPLHEKNKLYKKYIEQGKIRQYGHAMLTVFDDNGQEKGFGEGYNLVVDAGKGELADLMLGVVTNTINNMNVGTSSQVAAAVDTDLIAPAAPTARLAIPTGGRFRSNLLLTFSVLISSSQYTRPFTAREMGIFFDPAATGKLFARAVITAVTLAVGDTGRMDYEIQV